MRTLLLIPLLLIKVNGNITSGGGAGCFEKSYFYRVVEIFGITYNSVGQALLAEHICLYLKEKFPCLKEKTK